MVILFIDRSVYNYKFHLADHLDQLYGHNRVLYAGDLRLNLENKPYFRDWILEGLRLATSNYVCFPNADIILSPNWLNTTKNVFKVLGSSETFLIGGRINFDSFEDVSFGKFHFGEKVLLKELEKEILAHPHTMYSFAGIDTFTFRKDVNLFDGNKIPPFIKSYFRYDNWLTGWMISFRRVASFRFIVPVYHWNHTYNKKNLENAKWNNELVLINGEFNGHHRNAQFFMKKNRICQLVEVGKQKARIRCRSLLRY